MSDAPPADEVPDNERGDTGEHDVDADLLELHEALEAHRAGLL